LTFLAGATVQDREILVWGKLIVKFPHEFKSFYLRHRGCEAADSVGGLEYNNPFWS
jgi:hypothetical protein